MNKRPRMAAFPRPLGYYPTETGVTYSNGQEGMSLRDYFAAKAMQAVLTNPHKWLFGGESSEVAKHAYEVADSMLKAREE